MKVVEERAVADKMPRKWGVCHCFTPGMIKSTYIFI